MIRRRHFDSSRSSIDLRSYIERIDPELCHLCKDRKHGGGYSLSDDQLPVCDVCLDKAHTDRTEFVQYIEDVSDLSSRTIDITKIREGEEILGEIVYPEDARLTPKEHICRISNSGFYVSPYKCRWVLTELRGGYLVSEMNTDIAFVIRTENCRDVDLIPERMEDHPEYVTLFPSRQFAHEVTSEQLAANTI